MLHQKLLVTQIIPPVPPETGIIYTLGANSARNAAASGYASLVSQLGSETSWISVAVQDNSACYAIKSDGTLWYTGSPGAGTGLSSVSSLTQAGSASDWQKLVCPSGCVIALKTNGTIWAWGGNTTGATGQGTTSGSTAFATQIGSATNWATISCSVNCAYGIQTNGTLWSWGDNFLYGTGLNTNSGHTTGPAQVGSATDWAILGTSLPYCGFAIKTNGELWSWGYGADYQLGSGSTADRPVPAQVGSETDWIAVGNSGGPGPIYATCGIRFNGGNYTLFSWGNNANGLTGQNTTTGSTTTPTQVGISSGWREITGGNSYSISAIKDDKTLWAWGANTYGTTGQNTLSGNTIVPTQIGVSAVWLEMHSSSYASIFLAEPFIEGPGALFGFGANSAGQLGRGTTTDVTTPTQSGSDTTWVKVYSSVGGGAGGISTNTGFSFGIKEDGTLWAWGYNGDGNLGIGNTTNQTSPVQVGSDAWLSVVAVTSGWANFALGIKANGTLWGWGNNSQYQLGLGVTTNYTSPQQIGTDTDWIKVSGNASVYPASGVIPVYFGSALKSNGTIWSWGANGGAGCTGQGVTTGNVTTPTQIGIDNTWVDISCGSDTSYFAATVDGCYTLAVKANGTMWGWGYNSNYQLGTGGTTSYSSPFQIGVGTNWMKVSAGSAGCSFAINTASQLFAWGLNRNGQTGLGTGAGNTTTPTQVGTAANWVQVESASAPAQNSGFSIALASNGTIWVWGNNYAYNLGIASTSPTSVTSPTQVGSLTTWTEIAAGGQANNATYNLCTLAIRT